MVTAIAFAPSINPPTSVANNLFASGIVTVPANGSTVPVRVFTDSIAEHLKNCTATGLIQFHTTFIAPPIFSFGTTPGFSDIRQNPPIINRFNAAISNANSVIKEGAIIGYASGIEEYLLSGTSNAGYLPPLRWSGQAAQIRFFAMSSRGDNNFSYIDFNDVPSDLIRSKLIDNPKIFKGANLTGSNLSGIDLSGIDLTGAILTEAKLIYTDFTGSDMRHAKLSRTYLTGAVFTGADLIGADLTDVHLADAVTAAALSCRTKTTAHLRR